MESSHDQGHLYVITVYTHINFYMNYVWGIVIACNNEKSAHTNSCLFSLTEVQHSYMYNNVFSTLASSSTSTINNNTHNM